MSRINEPEIEQAMREHAKSQGIELGELVDMHVSFDQEKLESAVRERGIDAVVNETRADIIQAIRTAKDLDLAELDVKCGAAPSVH